MFLYYITRMRLSRVLNIALGNDPYAELGKIASRALQNDMDAFALGLKKLKQSRTTQQDKKINSISGARIQLECPVFARQTSM